MKTEINRTRLMTKMLDMKQALERKGFLYTDLAKESRRAFKTIYKIHDGTTAKPGYDTLDDLTKAFNRLTGLKMIELYDGQIKFLKEKEND